MRSVRISGSFAASGAFWPASIIYLAEPDAAPGLAFKPTKALLNEVAAHIATFSLAGVRAIGDERTRITVRFANTSGLSLAIETPRFRAQRFSAAKLGLAGLKPCATLGTINRDRPLETIDRQPTIRPVRD